MVTAKAMLAVCENVVVFQWFIICLTIMCASIFEQMQVRETGLQLLADYVLPFLKIQVIFADLHFSGIEP